MATPAPIELSGGEPVASDAARALQSTIDDGGNSDCDSIVIINSNSNSNSNDDNNSNGHTTDIIIGPVSLLATATAATTTPDSASTPTSPSDRNGRSEWDYPQITVKSEQLDHSALTEHSYTAPHAPPPLPVSLPASSTPPPPPLPATVYSSKLPSQDYQHTLVRQIDMYPLPPDDGTLCNTQFPTQSPATTTTTTTTTTTAATTTATAAATSAASTTTTLDDSEDEEDYEEAGSRTQKRARSSGDSPEVPKRQKKVNRVENSLGTLTQKFLELVQDSRGGVVDLAHAAQILQVQKRRIYDITNVLEGAGLVTKKSKNNIQWKGSFIASASGAAKIKNDVAALEAQSRKLDMQLEVMKQRLLNRAQDPRSTPHAYVSVDDVYHLPDFNNCSVIVIRAPAGTTLDVPDPDDGPERRYEMLLKSSGGSIDVFILENKDQPPPPVAGPSFGDYGLDPTGAMTLVVPTENMEYFLSTYGQGEGIADFFDLTTVL